MPQVEAVLPHLRRRPGPGDGRVYVRPVGHGVGADEAGESGGHLEVELRQGLPSGQLREAFLSLLGPGPDRAARLGDLRPGVEGAPLPVRLHYQLLHDPPPVDGVPGVALEPSPGPEEPFLLLLGPDTSPGPDVGEDDGVVGHLVELDEPDLLPRVVNPVDHPPDAFKGRGYPPASGR